MNLSKDQISKIISIVIMAAIALLAVFGYDVGVIQPQLKAMRGGQQAAGSQAVLGPYFETLNVGKNFKSLGAAEMVTVTVTHLTATTLMSQTVGFDTTGNGTAAAPVYTFASDLDTGLYRVGANDVGVSTNGILAFDVSATAATSALPVVVPAGAVGTPSLTFASDTDSGLYRIGANNIGVTAAGAKVLDVSASGLGVVGVTSIGNGTVSLPGLAFISDPDSGLYRIGADNIGVGVNGANVLDVSAAGLGVVGVTSIGDGAVGAPGLTFTSDPDSGLYSIGANNVGVGVAGAKVLDVSATGLGVTGSTLLGNGTVSLPGLAFTSDSDSGLYRIGANNLGVAVNGAKVLDVATTGLGVTGITSIGDGAVDAPGLTFTSDPNSGLYSIGANNIGIATNGVLAADVSASAVTLALPAVNAVGSAAAPSVTFTGDTDTGIYHVGANDVGIATNGALAVDVNATTTTFATKVMGSATEATALFNTTVTLTATQIHDGTTIVTVPAGRQFRLVAAKAVAVGGTCDTSTSVDILANTTHLVVFTTANLVQSVVLTDGGTGAAVIADGASYDAQSAGQDITVADVGGETGTCTGVKFILTYALD